MKDDSALVAPKVTGIRLAARQKSPTPIFCTVAHISWCRAMSITCIEEKSERNYMSLFPHLVSSRISSLQLKPSFLVSNERHFVVRSGLSMVVTFVSNQFIYLDGS
ncbi:hypothetical protein AB6A40_001709 [Gnathostoma spinigerum]|uniref:Uncharacterized protein n=1 Tax=Gnathostoma spinigerum TaxID=75299 RepID=A0ABD6EF93_9BILA